MKIIKKIALALAIIGGIGSMNAQMSFGGGLSYNGGINAPGLVVKAEFEIMEDISISPSLSYFSGSRSTLLGNDYKNNLFAIDVNGHYKVEVMMDELHVYPLAGLNYSSYNDGANVFFDNNKISQSKGNALGLNIGAGGRWKFADQLSIFAELKYTISDFSHVVLGAGVLYEL